MGYNAGGMVTRAIAEALSYRDAMYLIMTSEPIDGKKASEMRLVTKAVPRARLREETVELATLLMKKNPWTLKAAKDTYKMVKDLPWDIAQTMTEAISWKLRAQDPERGREKGTQQFLDDKSYRPGFGSYRRAD